MDVPSKLSAWCWIDGSCGPDWEAWSAIGTGLAAIATVFAVLIALTSAKREHDRTIQIRDDEWSREDARRQSRAAIYAHTFGRELLQAAVPLMRLYNDLNTLMRAGRVAEAARLVSSVGGGQGQLTMMERMADRLDGFTDRQAVAILNAIGIWNQLAKPLSPIAADVDQNLRVQLIAQRMVDIDQALLIFRDLQELLAEQAKALGFARERKVEDIARENTERRDELLAAMGFVREGE